LYTEQVDRRPWLGALVLSARQNGGGGGAMGGEGWRGTGGGEGVAAMSCRSTLPHLRGTEEKG